MPTARWALYKSDIFSPATFPVREHGYGYADFEPGRVFEHGPSRTIRQADHLLFTTATLALTPLYLDRGVAHADGLPDVPVNPLLVFCTVFGLTVGDLSERSSAFLGMDRLRFHGRVHPEDTLRATSRVLDRRPSRSRPAGIVTWHTSGFNQHGTRVIEFERSNLFLLEADAE